MSETQLRCPACGRWLGAVADYARLVCGACGAEVTFKSRAERRRLTPEPTGARLRAVDAPTGSLPA